MPLCSLGRHRAAAADAAHRVFPAGLDEPPRERAYGAGCGVCAVRSACPGVDAAYLARWGEDELTPLGIDGVALVAPPGGWAGSGWGGGLAAPRNAPGLPAAPEPAPAAPILLPVGAPCSLACAGCDWGAGSASPPPVESGRALRQRLVAAASERARGVVFTGGSPWESPHLPAVVREAVRLGFTTVVVRGPAHPLTELEAAAFERLAGLTAVEVPTLADEVTATPGAAARAEAGLTRLVAAVPGCAVRRYPPAGGAVSPLFRGERAAAQCQRYRP